MDLIYAVFLSQLQICLQDQNQQKSGTNLGNCAVNVLVFSRKKINLKALHVYNIVFSFCEKDL